MHYLLWIVSKLNDLVLMHLYMIGLEIYIFAYGHMLGLYIS